MPGDGLFDPLGMNRPDLAHPSRLWSPPRLVAAGATIGIAVLVAVSWLRDDGDRGRPRAFVPIERVVAAPKPAAPPAPAPPVSPAPPSPASPPQASAEAAAAPPPPGFPAAADQEVEIQNGVRIIRPRREGAALPAGQFTPAPATR